MTVVFLLSVRCLRGNRLIVRDSRHVIGTGAFNFQCLVVHKDEGFDPVSIGKFFRHLGCVRGFDLNLAKLTAHDVQISINVQQITDNRSGRLSRCPVLRRRVRILHQRNRPRRTQNGQQDDRRFHFTTTFHERHVETGNGQVRAECHRRVYSDRTMPRSSSSRDDPAPHATKLRRQDHLSLIDPQEPAFWGLVSSMPPCIGERLLAPRHAQLLQRS